MESPFFRNPRWYQQPDSTRHRFSPSRGVPVSHVDQTLGTHRPVQRPAESAGPKVVQIPVHFVRSAQADRTGSAVKIQKVFRGFLVRKCLKKIKDIKVQVDAVEEELSSSEVFQLVRRNEKERLKMNETLMSLLFKLDSICGSDFGVRVCRKAVIRKAIALQERIDAIVTADSEGSGENNDDATEVRVSKMSDNPKNSPADKLGESEGLVEDRENSEDVCCVEGDDKSMEVEGNDEETEIIDVGVDCEVKVGESNSVCTNVVCGNSTEDVKKSLNEGDQKGNNGNLVHEDEEGKAKDNNQELLEKIMEDNGKMMSLMTQLFERNETQTRMLNALTQRVELLEKAVVCDRLRKKKKTIKTTAQCKGK